MRRHRVTTTTAAPSTAVAPAPATALADPQQRPRARDGARRRAGAPRPVRAGPAAGGPRGRADRVAAADPRRGAGADVGLRRPGRTRLGVPGAVGLHGVVAVAAVGRRGGLLPR